MVILGIKLEIVRRDSHCGRYGVRLYVWWVLVRCLEHGETSSYLVNLAFVILSDPTRMLWLDRGKIQVNKFRWMSSQQNITFMSQVKIDQV